MGGCARALCVVNVYNILLPCRKVPESDAGSVGESQDDVEKIKLQALVCDNLLPGRKVPESDARNVGARRASET